MDWTARVSTALEGASPSLDADVIEELAQHVRATYDAARADGHSHEDAERCVVDLLTRWRLDAAALQRRPRRALAITPPAVEPSARFVGLLQDVRYAARLLRRQPRHALLTIATLAIAIGATTVLFSLIYGVLMRPWPWPAADRMVVIKETRGGSAPRFGAVSNTAYLAWRGQSDTVDDLAAWSTRMATLTHPGEPDRIRIVAASPSVFRVLGVRPLIGAPFGEADEKSRVVVLSESLWRDRFAADPAILGRAVHLDGQAYTVVAVWPDAAAFPNRQTRAIVPLAIEPASPNALSVFEAIATLRPGVAPAQAAAEATARARGVENAGLTAIAIFGSSGPIQITAQSLADAWTAEVRYPLILLLAAVVLLLVTATANVASLQLARATTRARELAIRAALGAGRGRVTRQLLVESALLGLAGGTAGIILARLVHGALPALLPADFPRATEIRVDAAVVAFAAAVAAGTSVACGLLPARRARRLDLVEALADDGAAPVGIRVRSRVARSRSLIMVFQVAIAALLLVGASLLGRSFVALLHADRGYDLTQVLSARLSMPAAIYPAPERRFEIVETLLGRLAAAPGVAEAAFTSELPLTAGGSTSALTFRSSRGDVVTAQASPRIVSPRYFAALRMRTIAGRVFADGDNAASERVVVVNESFARRYLGDAALGTKLPLAAYPLPDGAPIDATVIGVVGDVRYIGVDTRSQPEVYYPYRQMGARLPVQTVTLLARTTGSEGAVAPVLVAAVRATDDRLVADVVMPLEGRLLSTTLARPRLYATLLGGFAGVALGIAGVGLFGLMSYAVSLRSRELAIRVALGAPRGGVVWLVVRQGIGVVLAGLAAGMGAATALGRLLATQLYGVTAYDLATFVGVPIVLLAVAVAATVIPAIRAATIDPLQVLRGA